MILVIVVVIIPLIVEKQNKIKFEKIKILNKLKNYLLHYIRIKKSFYIKYIYLFYK